MQYFKQGTEAGYHTPQMMKEVWNVQLALVDKLMEVCRRYGLQVWMEGGTLLGAVRHEGYIPWDDDIDLMMPRDDYDRLNKIAAKEFEDPYFWQTTYSEQWFMCGHAILRDKRTTCFGLHETDRPYCQGIGIDIFVVDGVPSTSVGYALHRMTVKVLKAVAELHLRQHRRFVSHKTIFRWTESLFRLNSVRKKKRLGLISWRYRHKEIHSCNQFAETVMLPFCGRQLPAPSGYKDYLTDLYGPDYMTPVNAPNRHGHKYLDTHTPWQESAQLLRQDPTLGEERIKMLYL